MADTLIAIVNEVLRATQQRCDKTSFSNNDDTNYIVDRVNDALEDIYALKGTEIDTDGTITVTAATRKFNAPADTDPSRIYDWSFRINDADGDIKLEVVTRQFITENFPLFETEEADVPKYVYIDNVQIAVYPLLTTGASSLTMQFTYPAQFVKLTTTTATFPFEDRSDEMRFVKLSAQFDYEVFKGLGQPASTMDKRDGVWARVVAKNAKTRKKGFMGYRRYGV